MHLVTELYLCSLLSVSFRCYLCVCTCVLHVCVYAGMYVCSCPCLWMPEIVFLHQPPLYILRQGLSLAKISPNLSCQQVPGIPVSSALGSQTRSAGPLFSFSFYFFSTRFLRIKFRSSCLQGRQFTREPIFYLQEYSCHTYTVKEANVYKAP